MVDLFKIKVPAKQRHPQFQNLRSSAAHARVRAYLNQAYAEMGDPNGSFVRNFQGREFHGRTFELACFAYLRSADLTINRGYDTPDFMVANGECEAAIEVTTSNPAQEGNQDLSMLNMEHFEPWDDSGDFEVHLSDKLPARILATLKKKLKRRYHNLAHVAGKPLVLMVAPFFEPGSVFCPDFSLLDVLYPTERDPAVAPFFCLPDATPISAVAYCNSFTVPKFWRLADHAFLADERIALRTGLGVFEGEADLKAFRYRIGHEATPPESWSEGVTIFFNPNATTPLPRNFLPASCRYVCDDAMVRPYVTGFHPVASRMRVFPIKRDEEAADPG